MKASWQVMYNACTDLNGSSRSVQKCVTQKSQSSLECAPSGYRIIYFFERRLLIENENNGNPTCSLFGSGPIRSVVTIRTNLIGHYVARPLF